MPWWKQLCDEKEDFDLLQRRAPVFLIIYDVVDNRRRYRIQKLLKSYGNRIQRSAFECHLTDTQYSDLVKQIEKIIFEQEDLVCVYRIPANAIIKYWGNIKKVEEQETFWIV